MKSKFSKDVSLKLACIPYKLYDAILKIKKKHKLIVWKFFLSKFSRKDSVKFMSDEIDKIQEIETFIFT